VREEVGGDGEPGVIVSPTPDVGRLVRVKGLVDKGAGEIL